MKKSSRCLYFTTKFASFSVVAFLLLSLSGCFSIQGRVTWDSESKWYAKSRQESLPVPKPIYVGVHTAMHSGGRCDAIFYIPFVLLSLPFDATLDTLCLPYDIPSYYSDKAKQSKNRLAAQTRLLAFGKPVPDFKIWNLIPKGTLMTAETFKKTYRLSTLRGKPVLLHFWHSELKDGVAAEGDAGTSNLTLIREIHQKFGKHITVLSLTNNGDLADEFTKAHNMTWKNGTVYNAHKDFHFDPKKPFYVLIDADGREVAHSTEGVPLNPPASLPAVQSEKEALQVVASILTNSAPPR
jgi:uncharacterized protein YceK